MTSVKKTTRLPEDRRAEARNGKTIERLTTIDESDCDFDSVYDSDCTNFFINMSLKRSCQCHSAKKRQQMMMIMRNNTSWQFRFVITRYATKILISILLSIVILASAQEVTRDTDKLHRSNNTESHRNQTHTTAIHTPLLKVHSQSQNQGLPNQQLGQKPASVQGFSVNRNSLISGDSVLQRQLREKAKQDSLESIKMHILMRLNLKKLPNITKPINVPQNILENFYKNYNSSLFNSMWGHKSKPNGAATSALNKPESALSMHEDTVTDSVNVTQNIEQSSNNNYKYEASNRNTSLEMQGDDPNNFKNFHYIYNIEIDQRAQTSKQKVTDFTINDDDIEYESILSHISRVYIFPEREL
ncbi:uncharacterized protein LOC108655397 [Drosophila navojoa]|uniref:uncharacterized protein LOC108655397 n=1 Tax=Drosophila navojoa TaxID=7232 RepID=UPI0011BD8526|nr:uncharacterized protein LOC108655397 [Drosophila navojoa]